VTLIRFAFTDVSDSELTVCHRPGAPWVSGQARDARPDEVKRITAAALDRFSDAASMPGVQSSAV
jgi:hypothetical protein